MARKGLTEEAIHLQLDQYASDASLSELSDDDSVVDKDYTQPNVSSESDSDGEIPSPRKASYHMVRHATVRSISSKVSVKRALSFGGDGAASTSGDNWLGIPTESSTEPASGVGATPCAPATTATPGVPTLPVASSPVAGTSGVAQSHRRVGRGRRGRGRRGRGRDVQVEEESDGDDTRLRPVPKKPRQGGRRPVTRVGPPSTTTLASTTLADPTLAPDSDSSTPPISPPHPAASPLPHTASPAASLHGSPLPTTPANWQWEDGSEFEPEHMEFLDEDVAGCVDPQLTSQSARKDFFTAIFTMGLVQQIVTLTNSYAEYRRTGIVRTKYSRLHGKDITTSEFYTFLALVMLMGIVKKKKLQDYWNTDPLTATPFFSRAMARNRFQYILSSLHFFDIVDPAHRQNNDKIRRIRLVFDHCRKIFSDLFRPYRDLVIDESLVLWRGNLSFKQYIPSKRHRFGFKIFVMCDCKTGYVMDMIVYVGEQTEIIYDKLVGVSGSVVKQMLDKYLGRGHVVYLDNWYTSPLLANYLSQHQTGICGTVKTTRKHMLKVHAKLERKEAVFFEATNILLTKWMDKREVNLLSTVHRPLVFKTRSLRWADGKKSNVWKPESVVEYNLKMRQVDQSDAMISSIECGRPTIKWYKKMFFHLLDVSVLNAHLLHRHVTGKKETLKTFVTEVCREVLNVHTIDHGVQPIARSSKETPLRLTERHFITKVETSHKGSRRQLRCKVCQHTTLAPQKRRDTITKCAQCDVGLCLEKCFEAYHTRLHY